MREKIQHRTKKLGMEVILLTAFLPKTVTGSIIGKQIIRCATSIGANYRAACRARSVPDFVNKLKIVEEETDETLYWLEIIDELKLIETSKIILVKKEVIEILSIIVATIKTIKNKNC